MSTEYIMGTCLYWMNIESGLRWSAGIGMIGMDVKRNRRTIVSKSKKEDLEAETQRSVFTCDIEYNS